MNKNLNYINGDIFDNITESQPTVLVHLCNDIGAWGKGFVLSLSKYSKKPEQVFKSNYRNGRDSKLGDIQTVEVSENLTVVNIIGQQGIYSRNGRPPIRYSYLQRGLLKVGLIAKEKDAEVIMPKIGAGLAGGDWKLIEQIIIQELVENGIKTTVFIK